MPQYLSPIGNDQFIDANGDPLTGGQIETYLSGSSTPAATYTSSSGVSQQTNPIILNSLGYPTLGPVWLTGGISYKFIIKDALGATLRTIDDVAGVNDATLSQSEWLESGFVPTYISGTSFSVPGDQTPLLQIGRKTRTQNTSGFIYSTITNSVFAAGITTVTLANDSGTLDAGISAVAYALLAASPLSVPALPFSQITGVVPIAQGGTGATTAVAARGSLEATRAIQPVSASVASNAMTLTLNPTSLEFRSPTAGSGAINTRTVAAAITLVISSGSTLGTTSGVASRIVVLAIDNAGTVELAAVNLAGGVNLDEAGVISTTAEGGSGAADSATVIYSTTARTNVPYRVVGYVDSTQATAGTWATAPSLIQGSSGGTYTANAGANWSDVTGSRGMNVAYRNVSGKDREVIGYCTNISAGVIEVQINGVPMWRLTAATSAPEMPFNFTVPHGSTYQINMGGTLTLTRWHERDR